MVTEVENQVFNSPKVNLEITSFKSMLYWVEYMHKHDIKDIWGFVTSILPNNIWNIHNFHLVEKRFAHFPSNERIINYLRNSDHYVVIRVDLHNPFLGCHITIFENKEKALEGTPTPNQILIHNDTREIMIQHYMLPGVERIVSVLNPFNFYAEFRHFISFENANKGHRTLIVQHPDEILTTKEEIVYYRHAHFGNVPIETFGTWKDKINGLYEKAKDQATLLVNDESFYTAPRNLMRTIDDYVSLANRDPKRCTEAVRINPIVRDRAGRIAQSMKRHSAALGLFGTDFNQTFIPYLEPGMMKAEFQFGIITH